MVANNATMQRRIELKNIVPAATSEARLLSSQQPVSTPKYIRLPRVGERDPLCGLSRSELWTLITTNKIKSLSLLQPGKRRGVRLIDAESLVDFIQSVAV
jgi:hypothetical protein